MLQLGYSMECYFVCGIHTSVVAIFGRYVNTDCSSVTVAEVRVYDCTLLFGFALLDIYYLYLVCFPVGRFLVSIYFDR